MGPITAALHQVASKTARVLARFEAHAALEAEVFANLPLLGGRRLLHRRNEATTRQIPQTRRGFEPRRGSKFVHVTRTLRIESSEMKNRIFFYFTHAKWTCCNSSLHLKIHRTR